MSADSAPDFDRTGQLSDEPAPPESAPPAGASSEPALPPVEPPSAGFIIQLFVVPALIVAAVIGVYLLFGRLASNEVDWREQVSELRNPNPSTRWRAALGLSQLLEADAARRKTADFGPPLTENQELAAELAGTLTLELQNEQPTEDDTKLLEYLIKATSWMDVPAEVMPPLLKAIRSDKPEWIRQQGLAAIAMIAGRAMEAGHPLVDDQLVQDLTAISGESTDVLRNLAAWNLGLVKSDEASLRLRRLMNHPDRFTRLQAAIGLARHGDSASVKFFENILEEAQDHPFDRTALHSTSEFEAYYESYKPVKQAMTAAADLKDQLDASQRQRFIELIEPLAKVPDAELRHHAIEKLELLRSPVPSE